MHARSLKSLLKGLALAIEKGKDEKGQTLGLIRTEEFSADSLSCSLTRSLKVGCITRCQALHYAYTFLTQKKKISPDTILETEQGLDILKSNYRVRIQMLIDGRKLRLSIKNIGFNPKKK